ncbi:MAG: NAD(P)/FAD-dependent oxidoreductase, partial [Methylobacteriaceae bacterium]|nr:NAD(P)/FAD-dependent oxidoreductase [Methylobacteriaceae bacterium]
SSLLAGEVEDGECRLRDRAWYLRQGIRLITGHAATRIDLGERVVEVGDLTALPFDRLVLATGSDPIRLATPGLDLPGVRAFRDLDDAAALKAAPPGARAVVIGGGLLGIEAAYGLARRGVGVMLVHLMDRLMERQLDRRAAAILAQALERLGITVLLGAETAAIEGAERAEGVRLADGRVLPADLVVTAVGIRPNVALARAAGLAVGRGILVDDGLDASEPGVHAIGECAEHRGQCCGLVEPAYAQAEVLARRLGGVSASFAATLPATTLKVSGIPVVSAGFVLDDVEAETILLSDPAAGIYRKLVLRDDRLVGALLVGDVTGGPAYLDLIRSGESVAAIRHELMFGWDGPQAEPARQAA